jgi:hypothetical protein
MVVWGGGDVTPRATGGRYDPAANTWSPTSTSGAPGARYLHTAVWTGGVMVVWGGYSAGGVNTGGRYDPVADTWDPTSIAGVPSARYNHTAIWTGSRMIVWGGYDGVYTPTGGIYDPALNQWSGVAAAGAPSGRYLHTAVWSGSVMIIWGGQDASSVLLSGGRYSPASDTWAAVSQTQAPAARFNHTAVWTGSFMIIWGGQDLSATLGTGGRYALGQSVDNDGDGLTECAGDCDDTNATVYPGAPQICDGLNNDCSSAGWPALTGTNEADDDRDGVTICAGDCDDGNPLVWAPPGEATDLTLLQVSGATQLEWIAPAAGGTASPLPYDTVRTSAGSDFMTGAVCVESHDATDAQSTDSLEPPAGGAFFYLVRAGSGSCAGPAGFSSAGSAIPARTCP